MVAFNRILFPVDFSEQCALAAPHVASFARRFRASVNLIHSEVLPLEPYAWVPQTERLQKRLDEFGQEHFGGLDVQSFVWTGEPAAQIVSHARLKRVDLIMMPTHGRGPFRRFVLGSVTTKVLHDALCPVWTSAHLEDRPAGADNIENLLCAVDLDDIGEHTMRYAAGLSRKLGAKLTIAHAVPAVEAWPETHLDSEFRTDLVDAARRQLSEMQRATGAAGVLCVGPGKIAQFVAHAARSHKADLVLIGRGGHGMLGRLRTNDYSIIRECESPVMSI